MKYNNMKYGMISAIIDTLDSNGVTNRNIIIETGVDEMRKHIRIFILDEIKKMKPDLQMIMWSTAIGEFCIYKESSLNYSFEPHKSKYGHIELKIEFKPIKGKIKNTLIKSRKFINKEYEGFKECPNCFEESIIDFKITRDNNTLLVCKKCKKFDRLITRIEKELDEEEKNKLTVITDGVQPI